MQKGISAVVVILVICIAIGVIWWGSMLLLVKKSYDVTSEYTVPSSSPSLTRKVEIDKNKNVQIYTNNKYKYQLEFPINWYIQEEQSELSEKRIQFGKDKYPFPVLTPSDESSEQEVREIGYSVWINVEKNPESTSALEWFKQFKSERDYITNSYEELNIDGFKGIKYRDPRGLDGGSVAAVFSKEGNLFDIRLKFRLWNLEEGLKKFPESEKIFNQIVSSFKFLE